MLAAAPAAARLPCSVQRLLINSELKPFGEITEGQRDSFGRNRSVAGSGMWTAMWYGRQQGMADSKVWVWNAAGMGMGMGMAGMGMGMAAMGMECSGFCCMQEVLINRELKPYGERLQGKRDLLGATEVWQAVW